MHRPGLEADLLLEIVEARPTSHLLNRAEPVDNLAKVTLREAIVQHEMDQPVVGTAAQMLVGGISRNLHPIIDHLQVHERGKLATPPRSHESVPRTGDERGNATPEVLLSPVGQTHASASVAVGPGAAGQQHVRIEKLTAEGPQRPPGIAAGRR